MESFSLERLLELQSQTQRSYHIIVEEVKKRSVKVDSISAFITPGLKTVGVKGDQRVYAYPLLVSIGMPDGKIWIDYDFLQAISTRITNECNDIVRVIYRVDTPRSSQKRQTTVMHEVIINGKPIYFIPHS